MAESQAEIDAPHYDPWCLVHDCASSACRHEHRVEKRPLRAVTHADMRAGRGSLLGDQGRRTRWWKLALDCGHVVQRPVRYGAKMHSRPNAGRGWALRHPNDALPAPKRARCDYCSPSARPGVAAGADQ